MLVMKPEIARREASPAEHFGEPLIGAIVTRNQGRSDEAQKRTLLVIGLENYNWKGHTGGVERGRVLWSAATATARSLARADL